MGTLLMALLILVAVYLAYVFYYALRSEPDHPHPEPSDQAREKAVQAVVEPLPKGEGEAQGEHTEDHGEEPLPEKLRNPETGEVAAVPTSYHFAKRWIKEAMVKEGLLERVYTQSELKDPETAKKTREALERFKRLKKYWA